MTRFWSRLGKLFGSPEEQPADATRRIREQVFKLDVRSLPAAAVKEGIAGVVMDLGYPESVATLVALADGSVSVASDAGGAVTGLGSHEGPAAACAKLISLAPKFVSASSPAKSFDLPAVGHVHIYLITADGVLRADAAEDALNSGKHPLSPLFYAAHALISECRKVDEKQGRGGTPA